MSRRVTPLIEDLGTLEPPQALIERCQHDYGTLRDFCGSTPVPEQLTQYLKMTDWEPWEKNALLFAHDSGVGLHTDEDKSVIWVVCGTERVTRMGDYSHQLLCGNKSIDMRDGQVLFVDTRKKHAVIANASTVWGCVSVYVKRRKLT